MCAILLLVLFFQLCGQCGHLQRQSSMSVIFLVSPGCLRATQIYFFIFYFYFYWKGATQILHICADKLGSLICITDWLIRLAKNRWQCEETKAHHQIWTIGTLLSTFFMFSPISFCFDWFFLFFSEGSLGPVGHMSSLCQRQNMWQRLHIFISYCQSCF
jgi:hypothetical protein